MASRGRPTEVNREGRKSGGGGGGGSGCRRGSEGWRRVVAALEASFRACYPGQTPDGSAELFFSCPLFFLLRGPANQLCCHHNFQSTF